MAAADETPQRAAFRFTLSGEVSYTLDGENGRATLTDVSMDGVSVDQAENRPALGSRPHLSLRLDDGSEPVDIEVEVVRHTETGFAGRFVGLGRDRAIELWERIAEAAKQRLKDSKSE
jgi:hypothetical protein